MTQFFGDQSERRLHDALLRSEGTTNNQKKKQKQITKMYITLKSDDSMRISMCESR